MTEVVKKLHTNQNLTTLEGVNKVNGDGTQEKVSDILTLKNRDYFLENPPLQPKKEIADYVEQNGILVPKRFSGLKEALEYVKAGGEIIIRSEHPDEYNGISGLLDSFVVNQQKIEKLKEHCKKYGLDIDWEKIYKTGDRRNKWVGQDQIFGQIETLSQDEFEENLKKLSKRVIEKYCKLIGLNIEKFQKNISYSYWVKLDGFNRSIIADSAIPGRYHIITKSTEINFRNYLIIDNGIIILDKPQELPEEMKNKILETVAFYEKIRKLEKFDSAHCPIVEFQTDNKGINNFLQYHRTRQIEPSTFTLDRPLEEGEFEAVYVRGSTSFEGIIVNTTIYYETKDKVIDFEEGAFDMLANNIFSETMSKKRGVIFLKKSINNIASSSQDKHLLKSVLFNSQITLSISNDKIPEGLHLNDKCFDEDDNIINPRVPIRVISDGRKAYVKFMS